MSSETNISPSTTEPNVRRRRTGHVDAFSYLTASLTRPSRFKSTHIHEVMCYNIWLDLIGFYIGNITPEYFHNSKRYPYFAQRMRACLADEVLTIYDELNEAIYEDRAKKRIMTFVRTMEDEKCIAFLESCRSSRFYREMMNNQIHFVEDLRRLSRMPSGPVDEERMKLSESCMIHRMKQSLGPDQRDDSNVFDHFTSLNEDRLVFLLKIMRKLRASIAVAASASHVPHDLVEKLGLRLREFDQRGRYSVACSAVAYDTVQERQLVAASQPWWSAASNGLDPAVAPGKLAIAYKTGDNTRSTLTFIVPIVCMLSVIPTAMAWSYSDAAQGSSRDSNFWEAVSGSIMQLLGLITFIWPTLKNRRLSPLAWVWIWILAGFSAACAVASVPLYLVCPTIWSFLVSSAGVLALAFVQLQVVHAI